MFLYFQAVYYSYVRNITINSELISENYIQEHITVLYSMKLVLKMVYLITYNVVNNIFPTSLKMKYWLMSIQIMKMDYLNQIHWLLEILFIITKHSSLNIVLLKMKSWVYLEYQFMWIIVLPLLRMIFVTVVLNFVIYINRNKPINLKVNI